MRPSASWAIDSEPIRARGIIVNYIQLFFLSLGPHLVGVTHSFDAENSPKCFRTQLFKSFWEDDVRSGLFRCSTGDSNQSFRNLPTVFYCSIRLLNNAGIVWIDGWNPMKSAPRNIPVSRSLSMLLKSILDRAIHAWKEQTA